MNITDLRSSFDHLKSYQKLQILHEIEMSYAEVVSDMELAFDAMLSHTPFDEAFYRWKDVGLSESASFDRIAS